MYVQLIIKKENCMYIYLYVLNLQLIEWYVIHNI